MAFSAHDYPQLLSSAINRFADCTSDNIMPDLLPAFPNGLRPLPSDLRPKNRPGGRPAAPFRPVERAICFPQWPVSGLLTRFKIPLD